MRERRRWTVAALLAWAAAFAAVVGPARADTSKGGCTCTSVCTNTAAAGILVNGYWCYTTKGCGFSIILSTTFYDACTPALGAISKSSTRATTTKAAVAMTSSLRAAVMTTPLAVVPVSSMAADPAAVPTSMAVDPAALVPTPAADPTTMAPADAAAPPPANPIPAPTSAGMMMTTTSPGSMASNSAGVVLAGQSSPGANSQTANTAEPGMNAPLAAGALVALVGLSVLAAVGFVYYRKNKREAAEAKELEAAEAGDGDEDFRPLMSDTMRRNAGGRGTVPRQPRAMSGISGTSGRPPSGWNSIQSTHFNEDSNYRREFMARRMSGMQPQSAQPMPQMQQVSRQQAEQGMGMGMGGSSSFVEPFKPLPPPPLSAGGLLTPMSAAGASSYRPPRSALLSPGGADVRGAPPTTYLGVSQAQSQAQGPLSSVGSVETSDFDIPIMDAVEGGPQKPALSDVHVVVGPYDAQWEGDLPLIPGRRVTVQHRYGDGWAWGMDVTTGQYGVFPEDLVEPIE